MFNNANTDGAYKIQKRVFPYKQSLQGTKLEITHPSIKINNRIIQEIKTINLKDLSTHDWINDCAKVFHWCVKNIPQLEHAGGRLIGKTTIESILNQKSASGCHDVAMIYTHCLKILDYDAKIVDTLNMDLIESRQWESSYLPRPHQGGHVFVEVKLPNEKYIIIDPSTSFFSEDYNKDTVVIMLPKSLMQADQRVNSLILYKESYMNYAGKTKIKKGHFSNEILQNILWETVEKKASLIKDHLDKFKKREVPLPNIQYFSKKI